MSWHSDMRERALIGQRNALTYKLSKLLTTTDPREREKGFKILGKLRRIDRELHQVKLPF